MHWRGQLEHEGELISPFKSLEEIYVNQPFFPSSVKFQGKSCIRECSTAELQTGRLPSDLHVGCVKWRLVTRDYFRPNWTEGSEPEDWASCCWQVCFLPWVSLLSKPVWLSETTRQITVVILVSPQFCWRPLGLLSKNLPTPLACWFDVNWTELSRAVGIQRRKIKEKE